MVLGSFIDDTFACNVYILFWVFNLEIIINKASEKSQFQAYYSSHYSFFTVFDLALLHGELNNMNRLTR